MTASSTQNSRVLMRVPATQNIKILLIKQGMTQVQLGNAIGVNCRQYLNALISGRRLVPPDNPMAHRIADFFGQPIDCLFPLVDLQEIAASASAPLIRCNDYKSPDTCQEKNRPLGDQSPHKNVKKRVRGARGRRQKNNREPEISRKEITGGKNV